MEHYNSHDAFFCLCVSKRIKRFFSLLLTHNRRDKTIASQFILRVCHYDINDYYNRGFLNILGSIVYLKGFFGAALLNNNRNASTLSEVIAIATTNTGCHDTYPTVFVRISASIVWIESIVWPSKSTTTEIIKTSSLKDSETVTENEMETIPLWSTWSTTLMGEPSTTTRLPSTSITPHLPNGEVYSHKNKLLLIFAISMLFLILCISLACSQLCGQRNRLKSRSVRCLIQENNEAILIDLNEQ